MLWNSKRGDFISLTDIARLKDSAPTIHHAKLALATGIRLSFSVLGSFFTP